MFAETEGHSWLLSPKTHAFRTCDRTESLNRVNRAVRSVNTSICQQLKINRTAEHFPIATKLRRFLFTLYVLLKWCALCPRTHLENSPRELTRKAGYQQDHHHRQMPGSKGMPNGSLMCVCECCKLPLVACRVILSLWLKVSVTYGRRSAPYRSRQYRTMHRSGHNRLRSLTLSELAADVQRFRSRPKWLLVLPHMPKCWANKIAAIVYVCAHCCANMHVWEGRCAESFLLRPAK